MGWFSSLLARFGLHRESHSDTFVFRDKKCPICASHFVGKKFSRWIYDEQGKPVAHQYGTEVTCPTCQRLTVDDPWIPDNENESTIVTPFEPDWVKCPHCGWRFTFRDTAYWSGERHRRCGQKLIIKTS